MTDRRAQQNFHALPHYFTDTIWTTLQQSSREKACSTLLAHAWKLGMRCPSESTWAMIHHVLQLTRSERGPALTTFERYTEINKLKKNWKQYKVAKKADDFQYTDYVECLPANPRDLQAEYYLSAFTDDTFVPCRTLVCYLESNMFVFVL